MAKKINIKPITPKIITGLFKSKTFQDRILEVVNNLREGIGESGFDVGRSSFDNKLLIGDVIIPEEYDGGFFSGSLDKLFKGSRLDENDGTAYKIYSFHSHLDGCLAMSSEDLNFPLFGGSELVPPYGYRIYHRPIQSVGVNYQINGCDLIDILLIQRRAYKSIRLADKEKVFDAMSSIIPNWDEETMVDHIKKALPKRLNCEIVQYLINGDKLKLRTGDEAKLAEFAHTPQYKGMVKRYSS